LPALGLELLVVPAGSAPEPVAAELAQSPGVVWAEPNYLCEVALVAPNDPAYQELVGDWYVEWPAHSLDALGAWGDYPNAYFDAESRPREAPLVAVVDTGVDPDHPDFLNPGAATAEVADGGQLLMSASQTFLSPDGDVPGEATDEHGHGTHLAGLIAAGTNNGITAGSGIAGLGYPARLLPIKVSGPLGIATHADIARGITYAADQGASVILVGMAGPLWSRTLQDAVDYAWERGCFVVAPASDAGDSEPMYPGACPHVFAVAATTAPGSLAWYSGAGDEVALAAPGGDEELGVYSTLPTYACTLRSDLSGPAYGWAYGTSQAAAHVAAAAALYAGLTGYPPATGAENRAVWQALQRSATRVAETEAGWDADWGYGLVAPAALLAEQSADAAPVGSIVGRVVDQSGPVVGATVTAAPEAGGEGVSVSSTWPTGAYRLANIQAGAYQVTAEAGSQTATWEWAEVKAGCDTPGVDFRFGDPPADAGLSSASLPAAAVCGRETDMAMTFINSGQATWTRAGNYCLLQTNADTAMSSEPDQVELLPGESVAPGGSRVFAVPWQAPESYGFYDLAWQMCQQGGVGRFGAVAGGRVSVTSFLDVPADHWAVAAIEAVKAAGIAFGYSGDLYRPDEAVTRAQMAVYISRAVAGGEAAVPPGPDEATFSDVPTDHWAFRYVEYAAANAIVFGYWDGYRPDEAVNRAQMAVYIARALVVPSGDAGVPDPPEEPTFPDVPATYWAYKWIEYCHDQGVVQGYWDGYHPEETVNRAQMAVYVQRAFGLPMWHPSTSLPGPAHSAPATSEQEAGRARSRGMGVCPLPARGYAMRPRDYW
jgi:subtilisin family serine protease